VCTLTCPVGSKPHLTKIRFEVAADGPKRFAVIGGGLAGVSVAWNLVAMTGATSSIDLFDAVGLAGGATFAQVIQKESWADKRENAASRIVQGLKKWDDWGGGGAGNLLDALDWTGGRNTILHVT